METAELDKKARNKIQMGSGLVGRHMEFLKEMVRIDSRSFNVNEYPGDRETPTDMQEILQLAKKYLGEVGFQSIKINQPPPSPTRSTPILMAEIVSGPDKPTLLMYAHLDKQPYMDDEKFKKWSGTPPTELRWSEDGTRAYGRGAADDLSGVIAIGMAVDAVLQSLGFDSAHPDPEVIAKLPCNVKVIFETEEESGSHSLINQILQNKSFFSSCDCVIITDVINPDQGVPGLTTSLRGIIQLEVTLTDKNEQNKIDAQTALYKILSKLIRDDHSLAIEKIASADIPVTDDERKGYAAIPTTVDQLKKSAGLLDETLATVPESKEEIIIAELRKSYANVRPGHRVAGGVVFGSAGARISFHTGKTEKSSPLKSVLEETFEKWNPFKLKISLTEVKSEEEEWTIFDLIVQSSEKDPHSGMNGGPFPVPELQLAKMIDRLITNDGSLSVHEIKDCLRPSSDNPAIKVQSLFTDRENPPRLFEDSSAKAMVEVRLGPGNNDTEAIKHLKTYLRENTQPGFSLHIKEDKGASPWMTGIEHPVFPSILKSLEEGYGEKSCLYGCGGSIPFVAKLMEALGNVPPICLGAYDPDSRMHEPGESLSMPDLLGCSRSIVHFMAQGKKAFNKA